MSKVWNITPEAWAAFRSAYRAMGPKHKLMDRWRYDLGWNCPEHVIANYLAEERANLVTKAGHA